jgi:hypothetical protein
MKTNYETEVHVKITGKLQPKEDSNLTKFYDLIQNKMEFKEKWIKWSRG